MKDSDKNGEAEPRKCSGKHSATIATLKNETEEIPCKAMKHLASLLKKRSVYNMLEPDARISKPLKSQNYTRL